MTFKSLTLTLATFLGLALSHTAFSATSATLFLEGYVASINELYIDPVIGALNTLDVTNGESARVIANATETSNNLNGYQIKMASVNAGFLIHNNGTSQTDYSISYDGGTAAQPPAVGSEVVVKTVAGPLTTTTTATSSISIDVTAAVLPSGAYTDTLILTMEAL